jgi:hypothetical protein
MSCTIFRFGRSSSSIAGIAHASVHRKLTMPAAVVTSLALQVARDGIEPVVGLVPPRDRSAPKASANPFGHGPH